MESYESYHVRILAISDQLQSKKPDFPKTLEAVIQLRADVIRDFPNMSSDDRQLLYMQVDTMDRLFANVFERERIKISAAIDKKYRKDQEE